MYACQCYFVIGRGILEIAAARHCATAALLYSVRPLHTFRCPFPLSHEVSSAPKWGQRIVAPRWFTREV